MADRNDILVSNFGDIAITRGENPGGIMVFRHSDNPWHPDCISFTARQARIVARALLVAADVAQAGGKYRRAIS